MKSGIGSDINESSGGLSGDLLEANTVIPEDGGNGDYATRNNEKQNEDVMQDEKVNGNEGRTVIMNDESTPIDEAEARTELSNDDAIESNDHESKSGKVNWNAFCQSLSSAFCPFILELSMNSSLIEYDMESGEGFGVLLAYSLCIEIHWSIKENRIIVGDLNRRKMIVYENSESVLDMQEDCIDLDVNGKRWEGSVRDGKPFGYGTLYDENGRRVYEGFKMNDLKVCYGIEYSSDTERVMYSGCYYSNMRFGKGILYNRYGCIDYERLWNDNHPFVDESNDGIIHSLNESITLPNNSFNEVKSFILTLWLYSLKRIVIGNECFGSVRLFELSGLNELESIVIERSCFTIAKTINVMLDSKRTDGVCRIVNCPKLRFIQIGDSSFSDYHSFELNNLPSLQSIVIGNYCFYYASSFSLTDLSQLQSVSLGMNAFLAVHSIVFENLPKLQSIQLDKWSLNGDDRDDQKTIEEEPYNYKNTLTMRNLPSLTEFKGDGFNYYRIGSVILENIPQLSSSGIKFGWCFYYTYSIQSSSTLSPISSSFDATDLESFIRNRSHYI